MNFGSKKSILTTFCLLNFAIVPAYSMNEESEHLKNFSCKAPSGNKDIDECVATLLLSLPTITQNIIFSLRELTDFLKDDEQSQKTFPNPQDNIELKTGLLQETQEILSIVELLLPFHENLAKLPKKTSSTSSLPHRYIHKLISIAKLKESLFAIWVNILREVHGNLFSNQEMIDKAQSTAKQSLETFFAALCAKGFRYQVEQYSTGKNTPKNRSDKLGKNDLDNCFYQFLAGEVPDSFFPDMKPLIALGEKNSIPSPDIPMRTFLTTISKTPYVSYPVTIWSGIETHARLTNLVQELGRLDLNSTSESNLQEIKAEVDRLVADVKQTECTLKAMKERDRTSPNQLGDDVHFNKALAGGYFAENIDVSTIECSYSVTTRGKEAGRLWLFRNPDNATADLKGHVRQPIELKKGQMLEITVKIVSLTKPIELALVTPAYRQIGILKITKDGEYTLRYTAKENNEKVTPDLVCKNPNTTFKLQTPVKFSIK